VAKQNIQLHEASSGLSATAELLVTVPYALQHSGCHVLMYRCMFGFM